MKPGDIIETRDGRRLEVMHVDEAPEKSGNGGIPTGPVVVCRDVRTGRNATLSLRSLSGPYAVKVQVA